MEKTEKLEDLYRKKTGTVPKNLENEIGILTCLIWSHMWGKSQAGPLSPSRLL